jgi:hypothetical protein
LKLARGEVQAGPKAIDHLESLAFLWRGDRIELESNRLLARLYVQEARYREAFRLLDAALLSQPNMPVTRTLQNEMAAGVRGSVSFGQGRRAAGDRGARALL